MPNVSGIIHDSSRLIIRSGQTDIYPNKREGIQGVYPDYQAKETNMEENDSTSNAIICDSVITVLI